MWQVLCKLQRGATDASHIDLEYYLQNRDYYAEGSQNFLFGCLNLPVYVKSLKEGFQIFLLIYNSIILSLSLLFFIRKKGRILGWGWDLGKNRIG